MTEIATQSTPFPWKRVALFVLPPSLLVAVLAVAVLSDAGPPRPGDAAPGFSAPVLGHDGELALADFAGKPVVLNFWASWCAPCDDEAPLLRRAAAAYGDRVAFVGVNARDSLDGALAKQDGWDLGYPSVRDVGGEIYADYGLTGQPETFFITSEGEVLEHVQGPLFEDDLMFLLDALVTRDG